MRSRLSRFAIWALFLLSTGCTIEKKALGPDSVVSWNVAPQFFCPGDPVEVSWDFSSLPKEHANCRPRFGGFPELLSCSASSDCPGGPVDAICTDGHCCRRSVFEDTDGLMCDTGEGCFPAFDITITADTLDLDPPVENETRQVRGSRTVRPDRTTTFVLEGGHENPLTLIDDSMPATMVQEVPETDLPLEFPFECQRGGPGWARVNLDDPSLASENVRIRGVRNTSDREIQVTGGSPMRGPITLRPGEVTDFFNGKVGGTWSAFLSPLDRGALPVPRCDPTDIENPWPDLRAEVLLECEVE